MPGLGIGLSVSLGVANQAASGGDTTAPTVTITSTEASPTAAATIPIAFTLSEVATDFVIGDITVGGGTAGNFAGSGTSYTCDVTPTGNAPVTVQVAGGAFHDAAGNGNTASSVFSIGVQVTLTYQPDDTTGQDCHVGSSIADTDTSATALQVSTIRSALIKFPIAALGAGATIAGGTLSLWVNTQIASNKTLNAYRILAANSAWTEASTWNYKVPSTVRWAGDAGGDGGADGGCSVAGTDHSVTLMGTVNYTANAAAGTKLDFTLNTTELAAMCAANHGFIVKETLSATSLTLRQCENATAAERPKLVITVNYLP